MPEGSSGMDDLSNALDLETTEQARMLLDAEEALGERTVVRILAVTWDQANDADFCWFCGCNGCGRELHEGQEGFVWGQPLGDPRTAAYVTLQPYCSQDCLDAALERWAAEFKHDLIVGYFVL